MREARVPRSPLLGGKGHTPIASQKLLLHHRSGEEYAGDET